MSKTTRVPASLCPGCGTLCDSATNVTSNRAPNENTFSICAYCGTILRFTKELTVRKAEEADLEEIRREDRAMYEKLLQAQFFIVMRRSKQK